MGCTHSDERKAPALVAQPPPTASSATTGSTQHLSTATASAEQQLRHARPSENDAVLRYHLTPSTVLSIEGPKSDLTKFAGDAVVCTANPKLIGGAGVHNAILYAAGLRLVQACKDLPRDGNNEACPIGQAVLTPGFNLRARHVIFTSGPIYFYSGSQSAELLASCYKNALKLANEHRLATVAFPAISCGNNSYPYFEAAEVALEACREAAGAVQEICFVLRDIGPFRAWTTWAGMKFDCVGALPSQQRGLSIPLKFRKAMDMYDWLVDGGQLVYRAQVGSGSFAKVILGKLSSFDDDVAIKVIHDYLTGDPSAPVLNKAESGLLKEMQIMISVAHPNIVRLLGVCLEPLACVVEFCEKGSLYKMLKEAMDPLQGSEAMLQLTWRRRLTMAVQAAKGLSHLHSLGILHRDLKTPNIMVTKDFQVKVGDFGMASLPTDKQTTTINNLNRRWMAPEVAMGLLIEQGQLGLFTKAADVYAFGLVLLELATFKIPFHNMTDAMVFYKNSDGMLCPELPPIDQVVGGEFQGLPQYFHLMQQCWIRDPLARPNFPTIANQLGDILSAMTDADP